MTLRWSLPLALTGGFASAAAFDPFNLPYAMVFGVAALVVVLRAMPESAIWSVLLVGAGYGWAFMAVLIWWMNTLSGAAYLVLVIGQGLMFAVIAVPLRAALRLNWWPLWAGAVWVGGEWFRGSYPLTGFPWGRLGHTAIDTPLQSWVRLGGMSWLTFVMFLVAACLVVLVASLFRRSPVTVRLTAAITVFLAIVGGALLPTGVVNQQGTADVALVQGDVSGNYLRLDADEVFVNHLAENTRLAKAIDNGKVTQPDLVLWPESSLGGEPARDRALASQLDGASADVDAPIFLGVIEDGPRPGTALNASVIWDRDRPAGRYVKRKLVPYGEYVPFRQTLGDRAPQVARIRREVPRDMLPGDASEPLSVTGNAGGRSLVLGPSICWDLAYDSIVRQAARPETNFLTGQTSNAAFTGSAQPEQQWKISRLRALETGRWMLVPSTNGITGVADADAKVVARAPVQRPAYLSVTVPLARGQTPALVLGQWLQWLLVGLAALGACAGYLRGRETTQ